MTPEAPSPGVDPWTHEGELYGAGGEYGNMVDAFRRVSVLDSPVVTLDEEQQKALDLVMSGKNMFITGVGGTGKSVMLKEIKKKLEEKGKVVAVTAPTGLAAEAIEGCTIHAAAGISVPENINGFGFLKRIHISRIKNYDVLMIDEGEHDIRGVHG
jgi:Cdc6-like AAA superfamily ATPase